MQTSSNFSPKHKKFFFIFCMLLLIILIPAIIMVLWNAILPLVLGIKTITYLQAAGILLLSRLLFGGLKFGSRHKPFTHANKERWVNMSNEEKDRFKEEFKKRFQ